MRRYLFLILIAATSLAACEGARNNTSWSTRKAGTDIVPSLKVAQKKEAAPDSSEAKTDSTASGSTAADTSKTEKH